MTPSPRIIPGRGRTLSYTLWISFRYYSLLLNNDLRGFLCFLFPRLVRAGPRPWQSVCLHARARNARRRWSEREPAHEEKRRRKGSYAKTLRTYRSRFDPFSPFARVPELPTRSCRSIFFLPLLLPALPLTININLKSIEKVLWSPIVLASSVFATSRNAYIYLLPRVEASVLVWHKRETFAAYTTDVPSVKSIFPFSSPSSSTLYSLALSDKRIFDPELYRQTDWKLVYSIFCSNNVALYDLVYDRQSCIPVFD